MVSKLKVYMRFLNVVGFVLLTISAKAQLDSIVPYPLDKSVLSGVGLQKIDLKEEPGKAFYQKRLYQGEDISIYVVSTETWNNDFKNFGFDEFIYMFHGEAVVKPRKGKTQLFHSGDHFFAPKGYSGEWEIRAGNQLHYELSVIATRRSDSTILPRSKEHKLFERGSLSGAQIEWDENGQYVEVLEEGVELTVTLRAERPAGYQLETSKEMLVHLLSGQITIETSKGSKNTFYSNDFFVLPKTLEGFWTSEGHGLVKYLTVEKTVLDEFD